MADDAPSTLKPIELWDEEDVLTLPVGEFDWLDFKASAWLTGTTWQDDLSKYVSAWANYGGGFLVIGVKDPTAGGVIEIDGGVDPNIRRKFLESLDQIIPLLVEPPLSKFRTHTIPAKLPDSRLGGGRVIIVVHVPESDDAPHQARNHKYYIRRGRHLNSLRHREIFDIAGRQKIPSVKTTLQVNLGPPKETVFWKVENTSRVMARYIKAVIDFPTEILDQSVSLEGEDCLNDDGSGRFWRIVIQNRSGPLFAGGDLSKIFELYPITIKPIKSKPSPSIQEVRVTTFADAMPPVVEVFPIASILVRH